jgi:hypothetical protein
MAMPAPTEDTLPDPSLSTEDAMQVPMAMPASVSSESTEDTMLESMAKEDLESNDQSALKGSFKPNYPSEDLQRKKWLQDLQRRKNWLPVSLISELQNLTALDRLISIKIGLTGFFLDYYKPKGNFLEEVFDSTTFRPLGKHQQDDFNFRFRHGGHNVFYLNHDLYMISSLLQLYVKSYKRFEGDRGNMIEYIMEALKSYARPMLSLLSHSKSSLYESIVPNGFCAYLAALTSYECIIENKNPCTVSLETLQVRISML